MRLRSIFSSSSSNSNSGSGSSALSLSSKTAVGSGKLGGGKLFVNTGNGSVSGIANRKKGGGGLFRARNNAKSNGNGASSKDGPEQQQQYRRQGGLQHPEIQPSITYTLTEDEEAEYDEDEEIAALSERATFLTIQPPSACNNAISNSETGSRTSELVLTIQSPKVQQISKYVFTEEELMANELNHIRQLALKQEEIVKMQAVQDELKRALKVREVELSEAKYRLNKTETELVATRIAKENMSHQLEETREVLEETKTTLGEVGSTLIRTQHELEEKKLGQGTGVGFGGLGLFWA